MMPEFLKNPNYQNRASALVLVLWAVLMLATALIGFGFVIDRGIQSSGQADALQRCRLLAESGLAVALKMEVDELDTALLEYDLDDQQGWKVVMLGEGGKLNLNWILAGEDPARLNVLNRYLTNLGLSQQEIAQVVDCWLDWVDPNDLKRVNGQEASADYQPANRPFRSMDEITMVAGMEIVFEKVPDWMDRFTLFSSGPIDIQWAEPDLLAALPGLDAYSAERLIRYRTEMRKTEQGEVLGFNDMADVRRLLGWDERQFAALSPLASVRDAVYRLDSTGYWGEMEHTVSVVARKSAEGPVFFDWRP